MSHVFEHSILKKMEKRHAWNCFHLGVITQNILNVLLCVCVYVCIRCGR